MPSAVLDIGWSRQEEAPNASPQRTFVLRQEDKVTSLTKGYLSLSSPEALKSKYASESSGRVGRCLILIIPTFFAIFRYAFDVCFLSSNFFAV